MKWDENVFHTKKWSFPLRISSVNMTKSVICFRTTHAMEWRQSKKLFLSAISHRNSAMSQFQLVLSWFEIIASCMANLKVQLESSNCDNKFNQKCWRLFIYEKKFPENVNLFFIFINRSNFLDFWQIVSWLFLKFWQGKVVISK